MGIEGTIPIDFASFILHSHFCPFLYSHKSCSDDGGLFATNTNGKR